jgi:TPR repeat protein
MRLLTVFVSALLLSCTLSMAEEGDLTALIQKAKSGDASAQYDLGVHYLFAKEFSKRGIETPPDYPKAAHWMEKAASQGDAKAQYLLGTLYERGRGVRSNSEKAMQWYKQAVNNGNMDAACPLARLYEQSDIHPKDPEVTRPCYMK